MKGNSNCCDATVINRICKECDEHCGINKFDCDICEDTGEVSIDAMDKDGNWQRGVEVRKCGYQL
jgi:hypothetical protein